jgi:hypothetical protein
MTLRLSLFVCLVFGVALTAAGQGRMAPRTITANPVSIMGDLVQATPRNVIVKAGDGINWTVNLGNTTHVKVKGTAVPELIAPRVSVRFVASIDKKTGKAQDKLDKITIFTPTQGVANRTLGVEFAKDAQQSDDDDAARPGGMPRGPGGPPNGRGRGPGMPPPGQGPQAGQPPGADAGIPGTNDEPPAAKQTKRGGRAGKGASVPDVASYEVCGQVASYHNHRLAVTAPNRFFKAHITAELSPDAEIALDLADLTVARPGDKVSANGYSITKGVCIHTDSLVITLANPLGEKPGRSHKPRPAIKNDTPRRPAGKAKPEPAAPADQNPPAVDEKPSPEEKPAGDGAAEKPVVNKDRPKDDENPVMDDPSAKSQPVQPKPDNVQPDAKKPDETPAKKPPSKGDEKDVFDK